MITGLLKTEITYAKNHLRLLITNALVDKECILLRLKKLSLFDNNK